MQCPQNFGDMHTYKQTDKQADISLKWSNRVQDIPKHVNPSKTGCRKFSRLQYFLLMYIEESEIEISRKAELQNFWEENALFCSSTGKNLNSLSKKGNIDNVCNIIHHHHCNIYLRWFAFPIPGLTILAHIAKNHSRISQRIKVSVQKKIKNALILPSSSQRDRHGINNLNPSI